MLRSITKIVGYKLAATDGDLGHCKDFLFDDEQWTIRYMVAHTGGWLPGRQVLVSPISLGSPDWESQEFPIGLTKQQLEENPSLDSDAPVSRRFEMQLHAHYNWPYYWQGGATWGTAPVPTGIVPVDHEQIAEQIEETERCHLRSTGEVVGYYIKATDGDIGHVEDFLVDDQDWRLRYMIVDTKNWLPGRKVLVSPDWIDDVDWNELNVAVRMTRDEVKNGPEFDPRQPVNREYETRLYDFHGRPVYW